MAVDIPATIAILGAGPIGIEAALYARFLGYDVLLLERGRVAEHVLRWGHVRMFSPFALNRSALGLAALTAQNPSYRPPAEDAGLTGRQWAECYLAPLAATDLLAGSLQTGAEVLSVGRSNLLKGDFPGGAERGRSPFRLLVRDAHGERCEMADIVLDTTGVFSQPGYVGPGGAPAIGELALRRRICYELPDVLGADRERFAGRRTLVVGAGYSAATTVAALVELFECDSESQDGAEISWVVRRRDPPPIRRIPNDRLPRRDQIAARANQAARSQAVRFRSGVFVESLVADDSDGPIQVKLTEGETLTVDQVVAHVGFRVDSSLFDELQVHQCYATDGPIKLAAALLGSSSVDCLDQSSPGVETLVCPEPNFYILGAKSYGRGSQFLYHVGLQQIREVFARIGGRAALDLYATAEASL